VGRLGVHVRRSRGGALSLLVESEDVNPCPLAIARPVLVAVKHDVIAFTDHAFELNALARVLACHPFEIFHERSFAIGHHRIVLRVGRADVLSDGFRWTAFVEH